MATEEWLNSDVGALRDEAQQIVQDDVNERIIVGDQSKNEIVAVDYDGNTVYQVSTTGTPNTLDVDAEDNVGFYAEGDELYKFDLDDGGNQTLIDTVADSPNIQAIDTNPDGDTVYGVAGGPNDLFEWDYDGNILNSRFATSPRGAAYNPQYDRFITTYGGSLDEARYFDGDLSTQFAADSVGTDATGAATAGKYGVGSGSTRGQVYDFSTDTKVDAPSSLADKPVMIAGVELIYALNIGGAVSRYDIQAQSSTTEIGSGALNNPHTIGIANVDGTVWLYAGDDDGLRAFSTDDSLEFDVSGTVFTPDGNGLENATVEFIADGAVQFTATTASDGTYSQTVDADTYTVEASKDTYYTDVISVDATAQDQTGQNFTLYRDYSAIAAGTLDESNRHQSALTMVDNNGNPIGVATESSMQQMLRKLPDIGSLQDLANSVQSRGSELLRATLVDSAGTRIDPAEQTTLSNIAGSLSSNATDEIRSITQDRASASQTLATSADISGGVSTDLQNNDSFTLYLNVGAAVDIDILLSPDGGATTYTPSESPISFGSSGDDIARFTYDANWVQLTGSNGTSVTAQIRELV